jgi:hypothetical protein
MAKEETISWFAGVDWGSERHQVCLLDARGTTAGEREFPHSGAGLAELGDWLLSMAGAASTVAVAIEVPHGPVVDALIDRGFVVFAINPKQLDRLRDRFSVAGAKDDRRDAYVGRWPTHGPASVPPPSGCGSTPHRIACVVAPCRGAPEGTGSAE